MPLCYVGQVMEPGDSCELIPGVDGVPGPRVEVTPDGSQVCAYPRGGGSPLCYTDAFRTATTSALHAAVVRIATRGSPHMMGYVPASRRRRNRMRKPNR